MSYRHDFTGVTEGIRPTAPLAWRAFDGMIAAVWQAEGDRGGRGYYVSGNPRVSVFFSDVSSIRVAETDGAGADAARPMARAFYVPAGMPLWTSFGGSLAFSHLDLHIAPERIVKLLAPSIGRSAAHALLGRPAERRDTRDLDALARLIAAEIAAPTRRDLYAESLVCGLLAGVVDLDAPPSDRSEGRLTAAQMRRIVARVDAAGGRRMTVAEMAEAVGLSESWFSHVFRATSGMTPLRWQSARRIARAKTLLDEADLGISEVADRLGFSDQAHFTRVFRQIEGETPAAWRRARLAQRGQRPGRRIAVDADAAASSARHPT